MTRRHCDNCDAVITHELNIDKEKHFGPVTISGGYNCSVMVLVTKPVSVRQELCEKCLAAVLTSCAYKLT